MTKRSRAKARNNARKSKHPHKNSAAATTKAAQRNSQCPSTTGRNKALTEIALVEAVADSDVVYAIGAALPPKPQGSPGQERYYPEVLVAFYAAFAGGTGTWRKGAAIMEEPAYWEIIRRHAAQRGIDLWERPPLRCNCEDARDRICPKPPRSDSSSDTKKRRASPILEEIRAVFRSESCAMAKRHGCFDPNLHSIAQPARANTVCTDGKVNGTIVNAATVEKRRNRGQTIDGVLHQQGGDDGTPKHGMKFCHSCVRPDLKRNSRIIVDMQYVPTSGYGGEAGLAVTSLTELAHTEPGADTVCYDGALRGVHLQTLADTGYLVFSPPHGTTAKPHPLELTDGSCTCGTRHQLHTENGHVSVRTIDEDGTVSTRRCPAKPPVRQHRASANRYDWYVVITLPCGSNHRLRINEPARDGGPLRIERLRQSARDDEDPGDHYRQHYGRREDAESINNIIERTFRGGRAISYTIDRQFLAMIGHAIARNAIADALWKHDDLPADPPAAA